MTQCNVNFILIFFSVNEVFHVYIVGQWCHNVIIHDTCSMSDVSQECVLIISLLSVDLITKHLHQPSLFHEWCQSVAWPDWSTWSLFLSCEITWWRSEYPNVVKYLWLLVKRKVCGGLLFWFCQPMVFSCAPVDLQDCKSVALSPVSLWRKRYISLLILTSLTHMLFIQIRLSCPPSTNTPVLYLHIATSYVMGK